jgi:hypothetical protein
MTTSKTATPIAMRGLDLCLRGGGGGVGFSPDGGGGAVVVGASVVIANPRAQSKSAD